jgi:hypothetical protein
MVASFDFLAFDNGSDLRMRTLAIFGNAEECRYANAATVTCLEGTILRIVRLIVLAFHHPAERRSDRQNWRDLLPDSAELMVYHQVSDYR